MYISSATQLWNVVRGTQLSQVSWFIYYITSSSYLQSQIANVGPL